ncbi:hypothetical protein GYB59_01425 [bacterium]|nr:hypothetical protein [bacterium]
MATQEQLESFHQFASEQLRKGADALSLSDLLDLWETQNVSPEEYAENVAAIQASLDDLQAGESGRNAARIIQEVRSQLDLPSCS